MQLGSIRHAHTAPPAFTGGIDFHAAASEATPNRFTRFSAHATTGVYGHEDGYESLPAAVEDITFLTVGARMPAAGIFEHDGRFYGRRLDNKVTFAGGTTWSGYWRLEQHPADRELFDKPVAGTITRTSALQMVVDGAQHLDVRGLPVSKP